MKLTIARFRDLIRECILNEMSPGDPRHLLRKHDVYGEIEYDPSTKEFKDRWGSAIKGPERLDPKFMKGWLDQNGVESVTVSGRKLTPKAFMGSLTSKPLQRRPSSVTDITFDEPDEQSGFGDTQMSKTMVSPRHRG